ncbi:Wilms tumor protein 1-interacting protein-like isoform X2 [Prinia subflava]|uniref:Wilms tumor protein 1-interacting protein-like isoform X2 n=1 Tax=Prinia subflava TaxID=208062 RepID=UPI002FE3442D
MATATTNGHVGKRGGRGGTGQGSARKERGLRPGCPVTRPRAVMLARGAGHRDKRAGDARAPRGLPHRRQGGNSRRESSAPRRREGVLHTTRASPGLFSTPLSPGRSGPGSRGRAARTPGCAGGAVGARLGVVRKEKKGKEKKRKEKKRKEKKRKEKKLEKTTKPSPNLAQPRGEPQRTARVPPEGNGEPAPRPGAAQTRRVVSRCSPMGSVLPRWAVSLLLPSCPGRCSGVCGPPGSLPAAPRQPSRCPPAAFPLPPGSLPAAPRRRRPLSRTGRAGGVKSQLCVICKHEPE